MWKEVLCLGRHYDPVRGEWHEFKPAHIKRAHKNYQRMKVRGIPLPAIWEHQKYIEAGNAPATEHEIAEWKRQYARFTFAHIEDSRINERGNLDMLHDVRDPADVEQLLKTKFVSPKVYPAGYWDTKGGEYDGTTIGHVAATPSPRQPWQKPFELSDGEAAFLAYSAPEPGAGDDSDSDPLCPLYDGDVEEWLDALELSTTDPTEGDEMADEKKGDAPKKGGGDEGGGDNDLTALIKALRKRGINIPDRVSDMAHLITAVEANGGSDDAEPEPEPDDDPMPDEDVTTAPAGGAPMVMSTLDKDPERRKRANAYAKDEREDARKRIDAALATGRLTGFDARKLKRQASEFEMSFTDGEPTGAKWKKLLADVAAAEARPEKSAWNPAGAPAVDLSTTQAVTRPNLGEPDPEDDRQLSAERKYQRELAAQHSVTGKK